MAAQQGILIFRTFASAAVLSTPNGGSGASPRCNGTMLSNFFFSIMVKESILPN